MISPVDHPVRTGEVGFTLIELLVTLTIISLLLVAVPAAMTGLGGIRLHRAARDLTIAMREFHAAAMAKGQTVTVEIDTQKLAWSSSINGLVHPLAPAADRVELTFSSPVSANSPLIRFMPDGSATDANVRLWSGGRSSTIHVGWLKGDVALSD